MCAGTTAGPTSAVEKDNLSGNTKGRLLFALLRTAGTTALNLLLDAFLKQGANYFPNASYS